MDANGGIPRQLTRHHSADHTGGTTQIWRMPAEGGPATQVTRGAGFYALESWEVQHLYFSKEPPSGIWRLPVDGGEETEVLAEPIQFFWDWTLFRGGI